MCGIILPIRPAVNKRQNNFEKKAKFRVDFFKNFAIIHPVDAGVAHPVERHLAKVEVASSSLVTRSK